MRSMQRLRSAVLVLVLGITMVACGGGDQEPTVGTTTTKPYGASAALDAAGFKAECSGLVTAFAGAYASLGAAASGNPSKDLETAATYFQDIADKLPKEIRADFAVFADAYGRYAKALVDADIDFSDPSAMDAEQMVKLSALGKDFSEPAVARATANVQAYLEAHCTKG